MAERIKVAFICVHNSCRSQMAEAISKKVAADIKTAEIIAQKVMELKNRINDL